MDPSLSYRPRNPGTVLFTELPFQLIDKWALKSPEKEAYIFRPDSKTRDSVTFAELKTATERLAVWFYNLGLVKGDRVGILSVNRLEYALCDLALGRLGVVTVRLFASLDSKEELTRALSFTKCRLLISQAESLPSVRALIPNIDGTNPKERLVLEGLPDLERVVLFKGKELISGTLVLPNFKDLKPDSNDLETLYQIQNSLSLKDDCTIYSTSGSTGVPKLVVYSYEACVKFLPGFMKDRAGLLESDRLLTDRPMAHGGGCITTCIYFGITQVIANPWKTVKTDDKSYLSTIFEQEKITCAITFPYILYDLVMQENKFDHLKSLRWVMFGGQKCSPDILRPVRDCLGVRLVHAYASTEMGELFATHYDDPFQAVLTGVGKNMDVDVKIVDDEGNIVKIEEIGQICFCPYRKWRYLDEENMEKSHDAEGYFKQGDLARMNMDGSVEIIGRRDDVISCGTVKVYPTQIEMKLCEHPDVDKAIVFGISDDRMYEVIGAAILPKSGRHLTSDDVMKFFSQSVNETDLMTGCSMAPKHVWIEDQFPLTSSGKVDKKVLRQRCIERL